MLSRGKDTAGSTFGGYLAAVQSVTVCLAVPFALLGFIVAAVSSPFAAAGLLVWANRRQPLGIFGFSEDVKQRILFVILLADGLWSIAVYCVVRLLSPAVSQGSCMM